jgi:L-xylulokinase
MAVRRFQPDPAASAVADERFSLFCRIAEALRPQWPEIEKLAGGAA